MKIVLLFLLLAGCSTLGLEEPRDFPERLAYAEGLNTALRDASTDALDHHEITSKDMEHVMDINRQAKGLLGPARLFMNTDLSTAEAKLTAAMKLLTELQSYLRARGVKSAYDHGGDLWKKQPLLSLSQ